MGVSLIYHLTQLGWRDVVLLEKNELTAGSTWHAAGLCTHYAHNITIMSLRAHSVKLYRSILAEETGQPVSFHACGALRVTRHEDRRVIPARRDPFFDDSQRVSLFKYGVQRIDDGRNTARSNGQERRIPSGAPALVAYFIEPIDVLRS